MKEAVSVGVQTGIPVILWGDPGTGKTSFIQSLGRAIGVLVEVVIASIREPSDFAGLPVITNGYMELAPPSWASRLTEAGGGLLFLDEISTAPPSVQSALLRVVRDKVVGDLPLPEEVMVVAAANPPEQTVGWDLTAPMANRFIHIDWEVDVGDWCQGMMSGWRDPLVPVLPEDWKKEIVTYQGLVGSFIHRRPELQKQVPGDESKAGRAWPSGRSWDSLAICQTACQSIAAKPEVVANLFSGCVGAGPALEYINWLEAMDLPDPRDILSNPTKARLPEEDDRLFAVLNAVVTESVRDLDHRKWVSCWKVLGRAAKANKADIAVIAAEVLVRNRAADMKLPPEIDQFIPLMKSAGLC